MATKQRDPEATRQALMAAGTELFAEMGFDGARVDAIARKARANKAMINYYFGGKKNLYLAILRDTTHLVTQRMEAVRTSEAPPDARLRLFIQTFTDVVTQRPRFPAMMLREILSGGRRLDDEVLGRLFGLFATLKAIIEQGVKDRTFRRVDPLLTHLSLVGSLAFFMASERFRTRLLSRVSLPVKAPPPRAFVRHLQDLFIHGISGESKPASRGPG